MISLTSLRSPYLFVIVTAAIFVLFEVIPVQYQYFIWEIFIDLQILFLLVVLFVLWKIKGGMPFRDLSFLIRWNWIGNILWFLFPLAARNAIERIG
jgi:hypothetical protein